MHYEPPPSEELLKLRDVELKLKNAQMAEIFGVSASGQFHKYVSDKERRSMGFHVLMFGMLQLALKKGPVTSVEQLYEMARGYGAVIDPGSDGDSPS